MAFVSFKDVSKIYKMGEVEIRAVDKINFEVEKGEFCVVVGPSGAGKTTVLNMLGVSYDASKFIGHDIFDSNRHYMYHSSSAIFDGQFYLSDGKVKYVDTST